MKKILAIVLSVIMALSLGVLAIGCDDQNDPNKKDPNPDPKPNENAVTLSSAMSKFDFEKGITLSVSANGVVYGEDFETGETTETALSISDTSKIGIKDGVFMMDNELDLSLGELLSLSPRIYLRGGKSYIGVLTGEQTIADVVFKDSDASENGQDVNSMIVDMLPQLFQNNGSAGNGLINDKLVFDKVGDGYKAEIDLLATAKELVEKFKGIVDELSVDMTVGKIYEKLGGDEFADNLFGDETGKKLYEDFVDEFKKMPIGDLPGVTLPELPETVEDLIKMLNDTLHTDLPAIGDKKAADYFKEAIKKYENKTVFDVVNDVTGAEYTDEQIEAAKEELKESIAELKTQINEYLPKITSKLESNKLVLNFEANSDGALTVLKADITIDQEIYQGIMAAIMGGLMTADEQIDDANEQPAPAATLSLTVQFGYTAENFVDVSTLKTASNITAPFIGQFKFVSLTETIEALADEEGDEQDAEDAVTINTYAIGYTFNEQALTAESFGLTINKDGTYEFTSVLGENFTDYGTWFMDGEGLFIMSDDFFAAYTLDYFSIDEDGNYVLELSEDSPVDVSSRSYVIILEKI